MYFQFSEKCFLSLIHSDGLWLLGNKKNPLPVCTYDAIRKAFPCSKDENFTGFELEEEDA